MDQLKEHLVKVKPYAFWIACTLVLLGSLGTWYTSTSTLAEQRNTKFNAVNSAASNVSTLKTKQDKHPNEETAKGMKALNEAQGMEIARGWALQYKRQEGVLVWPESFDEEFQTAVRPLRPIESVAYPTLNAPISDTLRRRYRDFIEDELPKLAEIIKGRWQVTRDASGTGNFGPNTPTGPTGPDGRPIGEVDRSMVLWNPANQKEILDYHYGFTVRESAPETLEVLYAQEDLWVLQNLMGIIKATNEGAEGRHDAPVKQIFFVRIGLSALGYAGQVEPVVSPDAAANPGGYGGEGPRGPGGPGGPVPGGYPQPSAQPQPGQTPAPGTAVAAPTVDPRTLQGFHPKDPANWRYVDAKNMPLAGVQLRNALATKTAPTEADALLTVAKRVPVRMYLEIDQRKLSKLLAEMGNAPLPVEVRQLRLNREPAPVGTVEAFFTGSAGAAGPGGGDGGGRYMPSAQPRNYGGGGGEYGGGGAMQPPGAGQLSITRDATLDTNLIKLEVYGIVYLYNPVIPGVLGLQPNAAPTAMAAPVPGVTQGG